MQTNVRVFGLVLPITWFICQTIVDCLNPVVSSCVLNQSIGHWLLLDALISTIRQWVLNHEMNLKPFFESFMDDETKVFLELTTIDFNIKSFMFGVLDSFFSFLKTYEEMKLKHITCCLWCLTLGLIVFILFFHMLVKGKKCLLWRNMIGKHCIPCWSSHRIISILLKMLLLVV
jgi:hypothetical protein